MCFSASKNGVVASTGVSETSGVSPVDWDGLPMSIHFSPRHYVFTIFGYIWIYCSSSFGYIWILVHLGQSMNMHSNPFFTHSKTVSPIHSHPWTSMEKPPYGSKHFRRSLIHPPNQSPKPYIKILPEKATAGSQPGPEHPAIFGQASRRASGDAAGPSCPPGFPWWFDQEQFVIFTG